MSEHSRHSEESRRLFAEQRPDTEPEPVDYGLWSESGGALETYEAEPFGEVVDR